MTALSSFRSIETKHDVYRGKHSMKLFCESLRDQATKIFNQMNDIINKRAVSIIKKWKNLLYLSKN